MAAFFACCRIDFQLLYGYHWGGSATSLHPFVDFVLLEFPEAAYFVTGQAPAGEPVVDGIAAHSKVKHEFVHAQPAILDGHGYPQAVRLY